MSEIWKSIPGYPGYEASSLGRIRSIDRVVICSSRWGGSMERRKKGMVLRLSFSRKTGYVHFSPRGGETNTITAHRAVWLAFFGKHDPGLCINHIDGNKLNNSIENLEVCTPKENAIHAMKNGITKYACGMRPLLSAEDVALIRFFYPSGYGKKCESARILGKIFGRSAGAIQQIAYGNTGKHAI